MVFSRSSRIPSGHVAVVSDVQGRRKVLLNHANWVPGKVSLHALAVDVSPGNDWSMVRVENSRGGPGSPYPVSGFVGPR